MKRAIACLLGIATSLNIAAAIFNFQWKDKLKAEEEKLSEWGQSLEQLDRDFSAWENKLISWDDELESRESELSKFASEIN